MAAVAAAAVVTAAALALAAVDVPAAVAVVDTAAVLAVAADAPVAAAAVVTAVAVAATKLVPGLGGLSPSQSRAFGPFFLVDSIRAQTSVARRLRGRPDSALSYSAFGNTRSSLATQPICHGITR